MIADKRVNKNVILSDVTSSRATKPGLYFDWVSGNW